MQKMKYNISKETSLALSSQASGPDCALWKFGDEDLVGISTSRFLRELWI